MSMMPVYDIDGRKLTRKERTNLGVAIARATCKPGQIRGLREIAFYCDCPWQTVWQTEQRALRKCRVALLGKDKANPEWRRALEGR